MIRIDMELVILVNNWLQILNRWPKLKVVEPEFPPGARFFHLENKNKGIVIYLMDSLIHKDYKLTDLIIPYIPFTWLYVSNAVNDAAEISSIYRARYRTPLFLLDDGLSKSNRWAGMADAIIEVPEDIGDAEIFPVLIIRSIDKLIELTAEKAPAED